MLTIIGGGADASAKQARINLLRGQLLRQKQDAERLRKRIGRLSGGVGIVKIGAHTKRERDLRAEQAKKALIVLEAALTDGVISGGGVAFLDSIPAVLKAQKGCDVDVTFGVRAVAAALEAPFCQLIRNHGLIPPKLALNIIKQTGAGYGFDVRTGNYACMAEIGVMDSLRAMRGALSAAASAAIMAITTDVMILHPERNRTPQVKP
jgi:chaperonin GroEL